MNSYSFVILILFSVNCINCDDIYSAKLPGDGSFTTKESTTWGTTRTTTQVTTPLTDSTTTLPPLEPSPITIIFAAIIPVFLAVLCISYLLCRMNDEQLSRRGMGAGINWPFSWPSARPSSPTPSRQEILSRNGAPPEYSPREEGPSYATEDEPPPSYDTLVFESETGANEKSEEVPST